MFLSLSLSVLLFLSFCLSFSIYVSLSLSLSLSMSLFLSLSLTLSRARSLFLYLFLPLLLSLHPYTGPNPYLLPSLSLLLISHNYKAREMAAVEVAVENAQSEQDRLLLEKLKRGRKKNRKAAAKAAEANLNLDITAQLLQELQSAEDKIDKTKEAADEEMARKIAARKKKKVEVKSDELGITTLFERLDVTCTGTLSAMTVKDIHCELHSCNISDDIVNAVMEMAGVVTPDNFLATLQTLHMACRRNEVLYWDFHAFDVNRHGALAPNRGKSLSLSSSGVCCVYVCLLLSLSLCRGFQLPLPFSLNGCGPLLSIFICIESLTHALFSLSFSVLSLSCLSLVSCLSLSCPSLVSCLSLSRYLPMFSSQEPSWSGTVMFHLLSTVSRSFSLPNRKRREPKVRTRTMTTGVTQMYRTSRMM